MKGLRLFLVFLFLIPLTTLAVDPLNFFSEQMKLTEVVEDVFFSPTGSYGVREGDIRFLVQIPNPGWVTKDSGDTGAETDTDDFIVVLYVRGSQWIKPVKVGPEAELKDGFIEVSRKTKISLPYRVLKSGKKDMVVEIFVPAGDALYALYAARGYERDGYTVEAYLAFFVSRQADVWSEELEAFETSRGAIGYRLWYPIDPEEGLWTWLGMSQKRGLRWDYKKKNQ